MAKKSVKRVCYSLKSHGQTLLEVSGGGENEEETSVRKVEKGVSEQSGNSREIVRRKGVDLFGEIYCKDQLSLRESVMWRTPNIPCVCYWDGRGFLAVFMRASSYVRKVENE